MIKVDDRQVLKSGSVRVLTAEKRFLFERGKERDVALGNQLKNTHVSRLWQRLALLRLSHFSVPSKMPPLHQ